MNFGLKNKPKCKKTSEKLKLYQITYLTSCLKECHKSIVYGLNEIQAIDNFRKIGTEQEFSNIVDIKPFEITDYLSEE